MFDYLILIAGLTILVFSGDWLVRGGASLAKRFHVSPMVIGVTIISLGTSAPEFVVSLNAALSGHPDISIGNVVGSNIANIALVLGVTALILTIPVKKKTARFDWSVMTFATLLFYLFSRDLVFQQYEGAIFVLLLIGYIWYSISSSHKEMKDIKKQIAPFNTLLSIGIIIISVIGLIAGSTLLVNGASNIALSWGISERVVSISVIAFGTSVPELVTSVMAARRKELDISVGNLIGSNIFNLFGVIGITSLFTDIPVNLRTLNFDWFWMIGICLVLFVFMLPIKNAKITWWKGLILLLSYFAYYYIIYK